MTKPADFYLRSLQIAGWLVRFYLLVLILRPVILRKRQEASPDAVQRIYRAYGRHSVAAFAIQGDKHHRLAAGGNALVAYAIRGSVAVSAGDPLASNGDFEQCAREYLDYSGRNGWVPCFYHAAEDRLPIYHTLGLRSLKIAEEALIHLDGFSPACAEVSNLQGTIRGVSETGMEVQLYSRHKHADPTIDDQLEAISQEWLTENHVREFDFTLDRFSLEAITSLPVFIAALGNSIEAFCTWLPYRDGAAVVLDLMRSRTKAIPGTLDFMICHSLVQLKGMGYREASLGITPLAGPSEPRAAKDLGSTLLVEKMMSLYGNRNLLQFKQRFAPRWEGRYLVYPGGADLPHLAYALAAVHGAGGFLHLVRP